MGLDIYLEHSTKQTSEKYPDHLCNPGYLRSSYNNGGFDHVLRLLLGQSLADIFDVDNWSHDDDDYLLPNTQQLLMARARAVDVSLALAQAPPFRVQTVSATNPYANEPNTTTAAEALTMAKEEVIDGGEHKFTAWHNGHGHFDTEGTLAVAMIPGVDVFGLPAVHVVYFTDDEDVAFYVQMSEIVIEFIDEALSLPEGDRQIVWSG